MPDLTYEQLVTKTYGDLDDMNYGLGAPSIDQLLASINQKQAKILGLLGNWTVSGDTMTTYDGGNTLASYTLTKDSGDNIVAILED